MWLLCNQFQPFVAGEDVHWEDLGSVMCSPSLPLIGILQRGLAWCEANPSRKYHIQWSLPIKNTLEARILSSIWRLSSGGRLESLQ